MIAGTLTHREALSEWTVAAARDVLSGRGRGGLRGLAFAGPASGGAQFLPGCSDIWRPAAKLIKADFIFARGAA
jgi:hypothetical protein